MRRHSQENVAALPVVALKQLGYFEGLSFNVAKYLSLIREPGRLTLLRRRVAEVDTSHKHLVVYCILIHGGAVFAYRRGKDTSETRLQGRVSVGVGGHVSSRDLSLLQPDCEGALLREMAEEIAIETEYRLRCVAVVNDDSDPVGKVHFGIVFVALLARPRVYVREESLEEIGFVSARDLATYTQRFENWSRICVDQIGGILERARVCSPIDPSLVGP